jgi:hypothetical protein
MDNVKRLYEEAGLDEEDLEIFGTLDPLTIVELGSVAKNLANKILEETGAKDTLITASHKWARITFPIYLQRYRKLIDVSDITPQALDLDPATAELKAELQKEQPEGDTLAAMLEILTRLNDEAYMEIFRHYVKREKPDPDPERPAPTYREFQKTEIAERLDFPLDKINRNFHKLWAILADAPHNQMFFDVTPSNQKSDSLSAEDRSTILLSLDKRGPHAAPLTEYDRRVYIAANALHEKNNGRPFTLQALYEQMGNTGKLGDNNREKLMNSLNSMFDYWLGLDNTQETEQQKNRKKYVYHGSFLPFEYVDEYENGQITNVHVHMLRTAPLIDFSKDRKQITTISRNLLKTPLSQTDTNLRIEHYLIQEIAGIKKGRRSNKMLYSTIFEETGQTTWKQQSRAKEKISALLAYYKEIGHILDYTAVTDGIEIRYSKAEPADKPKRRRKKAGKTTG